jgi:hypothetical protein
MAKTKRRAVAHNSLGQFLSKFKYKFDVEEAFIDCKEMSKNYTHGLIPMTDRAGAVDAVEGPWQGRVNQYNSTTLAGKTLLVKIPPRTQPHMHLKIAGEGMPIVNSNLFGDQIILIKPVLPDIIDSEITDSIMRSKSK